MEQVKVSLSHDLKDNVEKRINELELSGNSEYFRLLAYLDISIQQYQKLVAYTNLLYNQITDTHRKLNVYATPLQEVPIIKLESIE